MKARNVWDACGTCESGPAGNPDRVLPIVQGVVERPKPPLATSTFRSKGRGFGMGVNTTDGEVTVDDREILRVLLANSVQSLCILLTERTLEVGEFDDGYPGVGGTDTATPKGEPLPVVNLLSSQRMRLRGAEELAPNDQGCHEECADGHYADRDIQKDVLLHGGVVNSGFISRMRLPCTGKGMLLYTGAATQGGDGSSPAQTAES